MGFLERIDGPSDVKKLNIEELAALSEEIRAYIIDVLKATGGHLASNLGTVELTLALHYVFDAPRDKIIFDVGHQSYTHKIVTGRREAFRSVRTYGGISGFPKRSESPYDAFDTGHSSTSLSAAAGFARARDLAGENYRVIPVIGDGAIGSGMAFEALNDIGEKKTRMIVVLNDNEMSIGRNVGALSEQLARLRVSRKYLVFKERLTKLLKRVPVVGGAVERFLKRVKNGLKKLLVKGLVFEQFGFTYLGPIDGHNLADMIEILTEAKNAQEPVLLHVITQKGKGYRKAEKRPEFYHGVQPSLKVAAETDTFSHLAGESLCSLAEQDQKIVAITAAMAEGTGLSGFSEKFPERFFDVGIAEQHAVTFAAGLAAGGLKPFVCVYSTFLQRAYDQILHDVCLQNLPVTLLIDRAGVSGRDGETHHGIFDLSYLAALPNIEVFAPATDAELAGAISYAAGSSHPVAVRYPHGRGLRLPETPFSKEWRVLARGGGPVILAVGSRMVELALKAAELAKAENVEAEVVSCHTVLPLDAAALERYGERKILTLEDGVLHGGFSSLVLEHYAARGRCPRVAAFGFTEVPPHGSVAELFAYAGLTPERVSEELCRAD